MKLRKPNQPEPRHAAPAPRAEVLPAATEQDLHIERTRTRHLAEQLNLDLVDLRTVSPDPSAAALLDERTARYLVAVPLEVHEDVVIAAVADPAVHQELQAAVGRRVILKLAAPTDVLHAIGTAYRALTGIDDRVKVFEARDAVRKDLRDDAPGDSDDAPVVQVVQLVITQALRDRASDVHIEPHGDRVRVRYRIDGALHDVLELPGSIGPAVVSRIKILADLNIVERRRPQDGQISMDVEGRPVDIRVSTTSVVGGEKVVLRLLDKSRPLYRLEQLGMPDEMASTYSGLLRAPYGMVICAGP
ncbi:MAG: Flp pilus assembly complex ATPase component TadA, partial [Kribbellaceae bacterium]|nr:Flp pilus assembly complex ATPase component TadA [Kribbellaceae bacterium]